jgi:hypothetical protein
MIVNDQYKFSGWAFSIYGGLTSISLLSVAYFVLGPNSLSTSSPPTVLFVFYGVLIATHLLAFLGGILLLKQHPFAHKIALPASFLIMMSFPVGTIIGGNYLWWWFQDN